MPDYTYIEFNDFSSEWLIPCIFASTQGEETPFFICYNLLRSFERIDYGLYETNGEPWYIPLSKHLHLQQTMCDEQYLVFQVTDLDTYHRIWSHSSCDHSIAAFVFSADCQLDKLERQLRRNNHPESKWMNNVATWGYHQEYGAASDEHYAYFCARAPHYIRQFQQLLSGDNFTKRFQSIHCLEALINSAKNRNDVLDFLSLKFKYHAQPACYLLFHCHKKELLSITSLEDYQKWRQRHDVSESDGIENDYKDTVQQINAIKDYHRFLNTLSTQLTFEHNDHLFKLLQIDDFNQLNRILKTPEIKDYIDGFFPIDTDISLLQAQITSAPHYNPERLLDIGEWPSSDKFAILALSIYDFYALLGKLIARERKWYSDNDVNTSPILK